MAQDGIARAISPAHTMFDGDTVFVLGTGELPADVLKQQAAWGFMPANINKIGAAAADTLARAIVHAMLNAQSVGTPRTAPALDIPVGAAVCYGERFGGPGRERRAGIGLKSRGIETVREFSEVMRESRHARLAITEALLQGGTPAANDRDELRQTLDRLESIPLAAGRRSLRYEGKRLAFDLTYEIGELEKDLVYLEGGEEALLFHLAGRHPEFTAELAAGRDFLDAVPPRFNSFVTDRDGTVNNYCGRYYSSIQSVYNAVFLTRFARRRCRRAVILTSAPLQQGGMLEVSVVPPGTFVLAGSKGREALDEEGRLHLLPISAAQQAALERLNDGLARLIRRPEFEIFGLIGSGLQRKFGQSTVAHQDVHDSIPENLSRRFRQSVQALIHHLDPERSTFRTEDTGQDLEILLTVDVAGPENHAGGEGLRDFDKGDGIRFLDRELGLGLDRGDSLVCGDTYSDLPMAEAAVRVGSPTWSLFVTRDEQLREKVRAACPQAGFVGEPDVLVTLLNELGKESS